MNFYCIHAQTSFVRCQLLCNLLLCWSFGCLFLVRCFSDSFIRMGVNVVLFLRSILCTKMHIPLSILSESKVKHQIQRATENGAGHFRNVFISLFTFFFTLCFLCKSMFQLLVVSCIPMAFPIFHWKNVVRVTLHSFAIKYQRKKQKSIYFT